MSRHVEWWCRSCPEKSKQNANITTTEPAERHAEEYGHQVVAMGLISYEIAQGSMETEDPFAPRQAGGGTK